MFGVLLESRARRQHGARVSILSAAIHVGLVALAVAATTGERSYRVPPGRLAPERLIPLTFSAAPAPPANAALEVPAPRRVVRTTEPRRPTGPTLALVAPVGVPTTIDVGETMALPDLDLGRFTRVDAGDVVGGESASATTRKGLARGIVDGVDTLVRDWRGSAVVVHATRTRPPRYPEPLRRMGISGRVIVRFTVDTDGRAVMSTFQVMAATHDLFVRAVRDVLPAYRFRPSEVNGRRIEALAEMPFDFQIRDR